jgi:acyl phosphate:glycerol-3-phosphate acyltransferase
MAMEQIIIFVALPVVAYFLGSIPFAWVIGRAHGVDIRTVGSKNVGATNLGRTLGMKYFWQAFILDAAKGFVPVLAAAVLIRYWNGLSFAVRPAWQPLPGWAPLITGGMCLMGHLFPIWLKGLRGGKGVATGFGAVLGFWPLYTLAAVAGGTFFVLMLMVYRYISLASMTASMVFVGVVAWLGWYDPLADTFLGIETKMTWPQLWPLIVVAGAFSLSIVIRHRANIVRLMKGTEPQLKIGRKDAVKE